MFVCLSQSACVCACLPISVCQCVPIYVCMCAYFCLLVCVPFMCVCVPVCLFSVCLSVCAHLCVCVPISISQCVLIYVCVPVPISVCQWCSHFYVHACDCVSLHVCHHCLSAHFCLSVYLSVCLSRPTPLCLSQAGMRVPTTMVAAAIYVCLNQASEWCVRAPTTSI